MNYAGRMNAFVLKGQNIFDAIAVYRKTKGMTHLEFNYPEHIAGYDLEEIKEAMGELKVNGFAVRWRNDFLDGNFTNPDAKLQRRAIDMCKEAADICRELGGNSEKRRLQGGECEGTAGSAGASAAFFI